MSEQCHQTKGLCSLNKRSPCAFQFFCDIHNSWAPSKHDKTEPPFQATMDGSWPWPKINESWCFSLKMTLMSRRNYHFEPATCLLQNTAESPSAVVGWWHARWICLIMVESVKLYHWTNPVPSPREGFGGLSPPNKAPSPPPVWNMKHYKLVEFLSNLNVKPPCTNVKPHY